MAITGIDHFLLAAPGGCEAEARRFFGDLLGLEETAKPESLRARGGVWFRVGAGSQELHVGVEQGFSPALKAHPCLAVEADAIDALAERLADAGSNVTWDDEIPGDRRFYASDPWGNRIEFRAA